MQGKRWKHGSQHLRLHDIAIVETPDIKIYVFIEVVYDEMS